MKKLGLLLSVLILLGNMCAWATRSERDQTGRLVVIPDKIHRVITLSPSLTDTVYALGASSILVGITDFSIYPREAAHEKPSVGGIVNPSLEKIIALHPDVVLALPEFNGADTIAGLQRIGIPIVLFKTGNIENIYDTVETVGRVLGRQQDAAALIARMHSVEAKIRAQSAGKSRPSMLLVLEANPLITAGKNAFITQMIELAGGRLVTDDVRQDWLQMSLEAVLPRHPDYILLMKNGPVSLQDLQRTPGWNSLEAVRLRRVIVLDDRIQVPAPVAFEGLEDFAQQLDQLRLH